MAEQQKWLEIFLDFIKELRINSKEITSADERGAPLNLWTSQRTTLEEICEGMERGVRNFLVLKSRQLGISTVFLALDTFWLAMYPGTIGALVTDTESNRSVFRETLEKYIASFPKKYLGSGFAITRANKDFILFSNGSRLDLIVAGTKNKKTWGEGRGYSLCHATECANYGNEEGIASFREALAEKNPNRLFLWESTAKGQGNHYATMWEEFGNDPYTKKRIFRGWWSKDLNSIKKTEPQFQSFGLELPDADERELIDVVEADYNFKISQEQLAWYRWRKSDKSTSQADLEQNQPSTAKEAFVTSGHSFFPTRLLHQDYERIKIPYKAYKYWMTKNFWETQVEKITEEHRRDEIVLKVWEEPIPGATYSMGVDPALGRNEHKDRHCISVWRCFADKIVQVAEYADNRVETRYAAWVLAHLAGIYRNCHINIELTGGPGRVILTEFEYLGSSTWLDPDLEKKEKDNPSVVDFLRNAQWYMYKRADSHVASRMKSFETTGRTKPEVMNQVRDNYSTGLIEICSKDLINEMMDVVQDGVEIGAPGKKKDDRVIALALANRVWIDEIRMGMIARGETYDKIKEHGYQEVDKGFEYRHNIIQKFFATQEEMIAMPSAEEQYWSERGLG